MDGIINANIDLRIKPCLHCGGIGVFAARQGLVKMPIPEYQEIFCTTCGMRTGLCCNEQTALLMWNRERAALSASSVVQSPPKTTKRLSEMRSALATTLELLESGCEQRLAKDTIARAIRELENLETKEGELKC